MFGAWGHFRTSRNTGVSFPLWWILFVLPFIVAFAPFFLIWRLIKTDRLSDGYRVLAFLLIVAGVVLLIISDSASRYAASALQSYAALAVTISVIIVIAKFKSHE